MTVCSHCSAVYSLEGRSSTRGCRSSRGVIDFSAISLQNFTKLTGFNLDRCPNLSVKGHQNGTSLWLFFQAPTTTPKPTTTATPLYSKLMVNTSDVMQAIAQKRPQKTVVRLRILAIHDVRPDMTHFKSNARLIIKSVLLPVLLASCLLP